MPRGIIDALYWRLHTAYLRNDREGATKFLSMLEDELDGDVGLLAAEVGQRHIHRFARMRNGVADGTLARHFGSGYATAEEGFGVAIDDSQMERDFCKSLANEAVLRAIIGASKDAIIVLEVDMEEFGRCDIVVRDGRTMHVIEVKMGEAPSSVVSQIDKYRVSVELDMCLGLYDEVTAHVVAASFPKYVAAELSRGAIGMIVHEGRPDRLRISKAYDRKEARCYL